MYCYWRVSVDYNWQIPTTWCILLCKQNILWILLAIVAVSRMWSEQHHMTCMERPNHKTNPRKSRRWSPQGNANDSMCMWYGVTWIYKAGAYDSTKWIKSVDRASTKATTTLKRKETPRQRTPSEHSLKFGTTCYVLGAALKKYIEYLAVSIVFEWQEASTAQHLICINMDIWIYGCIKRGRLPPSAQRPFPLPTPASDDGLRPSNSPSISWIHPTPPGFNGWFDRSHRRQ